ncbi:unnamed protein product [Rotaria magnacalcarata]|uniref:HTH CENPB-type domain-containing protein n=1 Tax=Rotaria magnacalcarata TaxID=392030 RepID=A0A816N6L5_9BILA|nr:unnamed protein product [Rotaria magnacalcarata]
MCHRKALTLEEKVALIKDNQNDHGLSVRQLGDNYKISKIIKVLSVNSRTKIDKKIDEIVFEWFAQQRAKQIPICGPILQEKARQVAEQLGYTTETFKASNGWLEKFRNRHTISFRTINGESASVDDSTVEEWTQRLSTILDGFNENDVFNAAETGLFYRATPDRSLVLSKEECKCGKKSKERLTVLLCSNLTGTEKLKPVVIAQTADQISITVLDAIKWIDLSWENVTENTIRNGFRAAGFIYPTSTSSSSMMNMDIIIETDIESNNSDNPLQQLELLLAHIDIGGPQLTAAEFLEMDACIPTFNEWDDYGHLKSSIQVTQDDNEEEEDAFVEKPPNLSEALEMMRRLHLFASIEQPQLHNLIYDLESQLTDIYLDSKAVKQSSFTDYFS